MSPEESGAVINSYHGNAGRAPSLGSKKTWQKHGKIIKTKRKKKKLKHKMTQKIYQISASGEMSMTTRQ